MSTRLLPGQILPTAQAVCSSSPQAQHLACAGCELLRALSALSTWSACKSTGQEPEHSVTPVTVQISYLCSTLSAAQPTSSCILASKTWLISHPSQLSWSCKIWYQGQQNLAPHVRPHVNMHKVLDRPAQEALYTLKLEQKQGQTGRVCRSPELNQTEMPGTMH